MKKIVLILIGIIAALYIALTILGSRGEYGAEKLYYSAMKANSKIMANPEVAPAGMVAEVEDLLQKIVRVYPKTAMAKTARVALAEFYVYNKKYDKAFPCIEKLMADFPKDPAILSMGVFLKGIAYEKQEKWPQALAEFNTLKDNYSNTQVGIQMPLYIAKYYADKKMKDEAHAAYLHAAEFYKKLEAEQAGKQIGYVASTLVIQSYVMMEDYEKLGEALEFILKKYPSGVTYSQYLPAVESVFVGKLKNKVKAIEIYKDAMEKVSDAKIKNILQQKIAAIEKLN